jgi:hypothetical protein
MGTLALGVGCQKGGPTLYPVSGTVTVGSAPLTGGVLTFHPEDSGGDKPKPSPTGQVEKDGKYSLTTLGKPGAPLGKYKVTVATNFPGMGMGGAGGDVKPDSVKVNPKYTVPTTSDLKVEVVASPAAGQYDIKVPE